MPKPKDKTKTPHYAVDNSSKMNKDEAIKVEPCVDFVVDAFESWSDHWANKFSEFEKHYDRWSGVKPKRDEEWQSNFTKMLTWQAEKALVARLHGALFPNSAPIDTTRTEITDDMQAILAKSIVAHWFKIGEVSREFLSGMRSAGIYGTGLFEDDWYVRTEMITEKQETMIPDYRPMVDPTGQTILDEQGRVKSKQVGEKPYIQEKSRKKVVEDRYRVRKANIFSWRIHPNKKSDDDDYPTIKQEFITYDDLMERQKELSKYGITAFDAMDEIEEDKFKIKEQDTRRFNKEGEYVDDKNPLLEVLHYWGLYAEKEGDEGYKKGAEKRPVWISVVNRKYKIKLIDNPLWHKKSPLFHIVWTEDEKPSYYGIGLAQIGADAEDRANNTINIRTDVKKKNIRGGGWYNANDKKIKKNQLTQNVPGLMKSCSDINNAVRPDVPVPADPTDYKEEELATNDHREITGATTALLPTADNTQQHKTLGGLEILVGQGLARLKPDLQMMEMMGIRKIANRAFLLTRQFLTQPEAIELMAPEDKLKQLNLSKIYKLTPREIIGSVHFFCTGLSETVDKLQNIEKLLKFTEVTGKIPQMSQIINYQEIAKQIATWLGFEDIDRFIQEPPPIMQPRQPPQQPGIPGMPGQGLPPQVVPMAMPGIPAGISAWPPMPPQLPIGGNGGPPAGLPPGLPPFLALAIAQRLGQQR